MPGKQYRQEIKQFLSPAQALLLQQRISAVLPVDKYGGPDGSYLIRSIYFDTFDDRFYTEKEAGISEREKIRIRFYNYQDNIIKLERKEKREKLIYKESLSISRETAEAMLRGDYAALPAYRHSLTDYVYGLACSSGLHPVVVVDYVRRAYVYPAGNVRITFDSALQAGKTDVPLWQAGELYDVLTLLKADNGRMAIHQDSQNHDVLTGNTILEIKFNQYFPEHLRQLLSSVPGETTALSKYTLCRQTLLLKQGDYLGGKL